MSLSGIVLAVLLVVLAAGVWLHLAYCVHSHRHVHEPLRTHEHRWFPK